ncbi:hypothetical protein BOA8489_01741 [Boseongicola aestuarii]|uniref:Uncharacterized protein n=1 Tax=Boseongicola aestuarii TaxID=1470561 RepID=A0A238IZZ5_9RHOB|nr:hypothetical protein BOA8489_01741 [Boseongicola aestuarii]
MRLARYWRIQSSNLSSFPVHLNTTLLRCSPPRQSCVPRHRIATGLQYWGIRNGYLHLQSCRMDSPILGSIQSVCSIFRSSINTSILHRIRPAVSYKSCRTNFKVFTFRRLRRQDASVLGTPLQSDQSTSFDHEHARWRRVQLFPRGIIRKNWEYYHALRRNGVGGIGALALKNLSKIDQFIPRKIQEQ